MTIYQVVPSLNSYDNVIGNYVSFFDKKLKNAGMESEIFVIDINEKLQNNNCDYYRNHPNLKEDDIVIYHICQKSSITEDVKIEKCKKIAIYHNTTPAHFFYQYFPELCQQQYESVLDIQSLNNNFDWCIADSEFNKQDLIRLGYNADKISVIPLLFDFTSYKEQCDVNIINKYNDDYINIIFVGQIVPNKKQEDIIRAYAYYKKYINSKSRLILIGSPAGSKYIKILKEYVSELDLDDVVFTEKIFFTELLSYYSIADIFLCMSEHEGFCIPMVEAMMFNIPIIAYDSTVIPYILNGSGILVDEKNPVLISKIIDRIVSNDNIKNEIINKQREQLETFNSENVFNKLMEIIKKI